MAPLVVMEIFLVFESGTEQTLFNLCDRVLRVPDAPPASEEMMAPAYAPSWGHFIGARRINDIGTFLDSGIYGPRTLDRESYVPSLQEGRHCRAFDGGVVVGCTGRERSGRL